MDSFAQRRIDLTLNLATGEFGDVPGNSVTLSGLRVVCDVTKAGGVSLGSFHGRVYGMSLPMMNQLSTIGILPTVQRRNTIQALAGDKGSKAPSLIFDGTISEAWIDFKSAPEVSFNIAAYAGLFEKIKPAQPRSYKGAADVAVIMADLAKQMGMAFENNGVNVKLLNPYFSGTAMEQVQRCAEAADIGYLVDNGKLAIWPRNGTRGGFIPLISPQTGMVGYPSYTSTGISLVTLFNPSINYGSKVQVQSSMKPACGTWQVVSIIHNLASEDPSGPWFTKLECAAIGYSPIK